MPRDDLPAWSQSLRQAQADEKAETVGFPGGHGCGGGELRRSCSRRRMCLVCIMCFRRAVEGDREGGGVSFFKA